jgi:AAT family amino acid transporter
VEQRRLHAQRRAGVLMSLQMVMFAYLGVEMIGLTAGEAATRKRPSPGHRLGVLAHPAVLRRRLVRDPVDLPVERNRHQGSPFVMTFERLGIKTAAGIINFVVITAALSSCNGGIFSTGRMLYSLAQNGQAPAALPAPRERRAAQCAAAVDRRAAAGRAANYLVPEKVFVWVTSIATFGAIWTWVMILLAQLSSVKALSTAERKALKYRMWLYPVSSYLALAFLVLVVGLMAYFPDTRVALTSARRSWSC